MIRMSLRRPSALLLAVVVLAATIAVLAPARSAWAASSVTVTNDQGTAAADPDYATSVTVSGSGFQSIRNGFGGVYVLFGWVDGSSSWKPSDGGVVGADYRYVPDTEAKDNAGFQRFIAFPGSDTASAAHGVMSDDGSWSVEMVIPGATFESRDRDGNVTTVDCLQSACGIITIGAHGVKNANNETFTPITFAAPAASGGEAQQDEAGKTASDIGVLRVGVASATVDAGSSIAFTGQGFTPGEQVVATLDDGLVSVGPLAAGAQGEVAGVIPVPYDVRGGTHLVTLTGAASGGAAETEVTITAATPAVTAESADDQLPMWLFVALVVANLLALALIVTSLIIAWRRAAVRRRERKAAGRHPAPSPPPVAAAGDMPTAGPAGASSDGRGAPPESSAGGASTERLPVSAGAGS